MKKLGNSFVDRHLGPGSREREEMLRAIGAGSIDELIDNTVPAAIRSKKPLVLADGKEEAQALAELRRLAEKNQVFRSFIGMGYSDCITPPVIQRNILENPGWYTQYTPYQAEIAQGRLEALLNFQTMVMDLTGLQIANASLLDEATAASEAMTMCFAIKGKELARPFFVSDACHPQTIEVVRTRAEPLGIRVVVGNAEKIDFGSKPFAVLLQYPDTYGAIQDFRALAEKAHASDAMVVVSADILSLALLTPPGEFGADVAVGSTQRFGVPMGFGGPHAAYFATRDEFKRQIPGRIVGVSKDVDGKTAIRLALQTREQHIRRDKATSNICTAQVLLAVIASMYGVYHGPEGLRAIASRVRRMTLGLRRGLQKLGMETGTHAIFDTISVALDPVKAKAVVTEARIHGMNFRDDVSGRIGISLDETTREQDVEAILAAFESVLGRSVGVKVDKLLAEGEMDKLDPALQRKSAFLAHPVFNTHHSETEMLRYMRRLESKDLSLTTSMIPLGSCTMKLNATAEMFPVTWPEFAEMHPYAPEDQTRGYLEVFSGLEKMLGEITGFDGISLQPNAGSQGEYAGLLVIRQYHRSRGEAHRNVCLIPKSAHGTNPASASLAGMQIVVVECDSQGNIDVEDLRAKAAEHAKDLAALMVTYPSTHGVFEEAIVEICKIVHANGGQVYMDGANMNAQVGLCRPGDFGPDVCHLNLHKTFCIPHGGGGPGMGPIGVKSHLVPFLPGNPLKRDSDSMRIGAVSAATWGSASILPISWMYITMMGGEGLRKATEVAILNANYIAKRLESHYPVLYKGSKGRIAHECIFDMRPLKDKTGIDVEDVAKRLMDYGFHAPTVSFPVAGTLMVEPTESESKAELDRFCEAMIAIRQEIADVESGKMDRMNNPLKNAPHTAEQVTGTEWSRPYSREQAVYPVAYLRQQKFWPAVGRINNVLGDRQLICACPSIEEYTS